MIDVVGDAQPPSGPHNPLLTTPLPVPGSMRRTWNVDISFPDGVSGPTRADVRGRDLLTSVDGSAEAVGEMHLAITIDPATGAIVALEATRADTPLDLLVGIGLRGGFGRALTARLPVDAARRSLCFSALEDLGGAYLVSGYSHLRSGATPQTRELAEMAADLQADVCIGWAGDGALIENIRANGRTPVPIGPPAPDITGEPNAWHDMAPLAPTSVRRRRRIDVRLDEPGRLHVQEHFRDSYAGTDGDESVMHEYLVDAELDGGGRLVALNVDARVLPWQECPGALAGAQRLVGAMISDLPARVRSDLERTSACTHLNSTLRALADTPLLAEWLRV